MDNVLKENIPVRIFFSKTDRIKYISHLDLNRAMQRAVKRSGLPAWVTEGFNPHIYITFALPLSLGVESVCESMDLKMTDIIAFDDIKDRLNAVFPEGLKALEAAKPVYKHTEIKKAEYEIFSDIDIDKFKAFTEQEKIIVSKKTKKKGINEIDLKPYIIYSEKNGSLVLTLPAGTELNINPALVLDAFSGFSGENLSYTRIVRTGVYTADGEIFK